jgi:MFS family permease
MRAAGELPPEKAQAANPLIEIFKGASLRYTMLGFLIVSGYMFAFYAITVFMPGFMRSLGAEAEAIRTITIVFSVALAVAFLVFGWFTDSLGRKVGVVVPTIISIVGFIGIYMAAQTTFPGSPFVWSLFGWYVVWGVGQTGAGMFGPWFSELYPVELRASAVSTIYMVGRGIGSIAPFVVPYVAAHNTSGLAGGMMIGLAAALVCVVAALLLPETAGRSFAVIETKARSAA